MAHDHHHHGESLRDYFAEQLLTIFVVGLFGAVAILMYRSGKLAYVLAPQFHLPVLMGGIAVIGMVVVRAIAVWREAGAMQAHNHEHHHHDHAHDHHHHHEHDHDHAHDHHHHDHDHADHGHSHDLAWVFARMMVLFFPVALFLIGVPNSGFSQDRIKKLLGSEQSIGSDLADVYAKEGTVMSFNDLNDAAGNEAKRSVMQGQTALLEGRFRRLGDKEFTLFRLRMTCCAADTIPLKVRIVTPYALSGLNDFDWVQVKGQIQFIQVPDSSPPRYIPVIKVMDNADVTKGLPKSEYE
jgi:hypothetical protein